MRWQKAAHARRCGRRQAASSAITCGGAGASGSGRRCRKRGHGGERTDERGNTRRHRRGEAQWSAELFELKAALQEWMILQRDFLPLPVPPPAPLQRLTEVLPHAHVGTGSISLHQTRQVAQQPGRLAPLQYPPRRARGR